MSRLALANCYWFPSKMPTVYVASLFFCFLSFCCFGQEIEGFVYDAQTGQRVAKVYIYNTANDEGIYNNLKGEFSIKAKQGDILIAATDGYFPDTLVVSNQKNLFFKLQRSSIWLKEVTIIGRHSPQEELDKKKEDYRSAYRKGHPGSIFSVGPTGAGLSIDAIYSLISKEGKNARFLEKIIERDYENTVIDYRYTPTLVSTVTGLKDKQREDFMVQYRPSYYFILRATDYELVSYIASSFQQYQTNPKANRLPKLPTDSTFKPQNEPK
ncbi:hypothetical protein SAMN05216436_101330 [bacterium A37T11]|nr:hypothetical protein SAMN05216436_101330 [bacterium A37T11]